MRRILAFAALGLVGLVVVYLLGAGLFFNQMLNRILVVGSAADLAAAGQPSTTPFDLAFRGDPDAAFGFGFETVEVPTPIGGATAWFVPPEGAARDVWAIFVHGIAGTREGGYRYLPGLRAAGYPTLMITYRNDEGAPASERGLYTFGLEEWEDLEAAVAHALAGGASGVIVAADSMGGGVLGQFLRRSGLAGSVRAILMDSPALDFSMVAEGVARGMGAPLAPVVADIAVAMFAFQHGIDMADAEVFDELAAFPGPVMLVHGSGDRIVPVSVSETLLSRRYGSTLFLRSHADHLLSRAEDEDRYDRVLARFLNAL